MFRCRMFATAACVTLLAFISACSSGDPLAATLEASSDGAFVVTYVIDGEEVSETVTSAWRRTVNVNGRFDLEITASDAEVGNDVSCTVAVDLSAGNSTFNSDAGRASITADGAATCEVSGTVSNDTVNVSTRTASEPRLRPEPNAITVSPMEFVGGAFQLDVPDTWTVAEGREFSPRTESDLVERRELRLDDLDTAISGTDDFSDSSFTLRRSNRPLAVDGTPLEIAEQHVSAWREYRSRTSGTFTNPVEAVVGGVDAAQMDFTIDDITERWNVFHVGTDLFLLEWHDATDGESGVDEIVASIRTERDRLPLVSHWTRLFPTPNNPALVAEQAPSFLVPADFSVDDAGVLGGGSFDVSIVLDIVDGEIREQRIVDLRNAGLTETQTSVAGTTADTFTIESNGKETLVLVIPTSADAAMTVEYDFPPADRAVVDEMIASFSFGE